MRRKRRNHSPEFKAKVALAAIQGMYQIVQEKDARISTLEKQNTDQEKRLDGFGVRLANLEKQDGRPVSHPNGLWFTVLSLIVGLVLGRYSVIRKLEF